MTAPAVHTPFSPSSFRRRALCPASYRLEAGLSEIPSEAAEAGSARHEAVETAIQSFIRGEDNPPLDEAAEAAYGRFKLIAASAPGEIHAERRMEYRYAGVTVYAGTADVVIDCGEKVVIIDWKFGRLPVPDAAENLQCAGYALAAMQTFGASSAEAHVCNPVINQYSSASWSSDDVPSLTKTIMDIIAACREDDAPIVPGEEQCRYCKAAAHGTCPALAKTADLAAVRAEELAPLPDLSVLTADQLTALREKCDLVAMLAARVDERIREVCERNGSCGPWRLKEVAGGREIRDMPAAYAASGMTAEDFLSCCTCSVPKLEKLYADNLVAAGETSTLREARARFSNVLGGMITRKASSTRLVKG